MGTILFRSFFVQEMKYNQILYNNFRIFEK